MERCHKKSILMKIALCAIFQVNIFALIHQCQCFTILAPTLSLKSKTKSTSLSLNYRIDREDKDSRASEIDLKLDQTPQSATTSDRQQEDTSDAKDGIGGDPSASMICEKQVDYVGAGTLGDIMSDPSQDDDDKMKKKEFREESTTDEIIGIDRSLASPEQESKSAVQDAKIDTEESESNLRRSEKVQAAKINSRPTKSGLVTSTGGTLTAQYGLKVPNMSPLDRIALTANGNLQRIFSSFYDAPVHVHVDRCVRRKSRSSAEGVTGEFNGSMQENGFKKSMGSDEAIWDRSVHLSVFDQVFCKATSVITVHSNECIKIVESGEVGIGQLFRYLDKLPTFAIIDAGRSEDEGLWRQYRLECEELTCDILEEFVPNAWMMEPNSDDYFNEHDNTF